MVVSVYIVDKATASGYLVTYRKSGNFGVG